MSTKDKHRASRIYTKLCLILAFVFIGMFWISCRSAMAQETAEEWYNAFQGQPDRIKVEILDEYLKMYPDNIDVFQGVCSMGEGANGDLALSCMNSVSDIQAQDILFSYIILEEREIEEYYQSEVYPAATEQASAYQTAVAETTAYAQSQAVIHATPEPTEWKRPQIAIGQKEAEYQATVMAEAREHMGDEQFNKMIEEYRVAVSQVLNLALGTPLPPTPTAIEETGDAVRIAGKELLSDYIPESEQDEPWFPAFTWKEILGAVVAFLVLFALLWAI